MQAFKLVELVCIIHRVEPNLINQAYLLESKDIVQCYQVEYGLPKLNPCLPKLAVLRLLLALIDLKLLFILQLLLPDLRYHF